MVVAGREFIERAEDGSTSPICMGSDGIAIAIAGDGNRLSVTEGEHNAVHRRPPDGSWETVVHDPRLLGPDTMSVVADRHLYVPADQLFRQSQYRGGGPAAEALRAVPHPRRRRAGPAPVRNGHHRSAERTLMGSDGPVGNRPRGHGQRSGARALAGSCARAR
jgi:hypothetical protein